MTLILVMHLVNTAQSQLGTSSLSVPFFAPSFFPVWSVFPSHSLFSQRKDQFSLDTVDVESYEVALCC